MQFPALAVFWSENNRIVEGDFDEKKGELQSTVYTPDGGESGEIFVLGKEDEDTDEYDEHILLHEWGHFVEDQFSRSDSFGGPHFFSDLLDPRVAFSEGFSNAWSAIMLEDSRYIDTLGRAQDESLVLDLELNSFNGMGSQGWFVEGSIGSMVFDLMDETDDDSDSISVGMAALFAALRGGHAETASLTSIFSFITALKAQVPLMEDQIDAITAAQNIENISDDFASDEDDYGDLDRLESDPKVYVDIELDGGSKTLCVSNEVGVFNKLGNSRFLKFELNRVADVRFDVSRSSGDRGVKPGMYIFERGVSLSHQEGSNLGVLNFTFGFEPGTYVLELYENGNIGNNSDAGSSVCFDIGVSSA